MPSGKGRIQRVFKIASSKGNSISLGRRCYLKKLASVITRRRVSVRPKIKRAGGMIGQLGIADVRRSCSGATIKPGSTRLRKEEGHTAGLASKPIERFPIAQRSTRSSRFTISIATGCARSHIARVCHVDAGCDAGRRRIAILFGQGWLLIQHSSRARRASLISKEAFSTSLVAQP